ncbi:peptidoglycan recognition family protein [uncultured Eudoraea sp.]|uniref:N-acetylmuramoyl-L-alanine amidase n=1 Tax=uncultured Eudoraea sp. TaxID=1035614 RepID=UPI0026207687|nr:peptidoglycan recognition family protein [uncultured Eudoraea sp.]
MNKLLYSLITLLVISCATSKEIVDRPIIFDYEREELTRAYLMERYGIEQNSPTIKPQMIVLHWTVIPTLEESFEAFNAPALPNKRADIQQAGALNVSSHFMVDRDGTIYRLMPETNMARHVIGLNHCAIGIENIGGTEDLPLTKAQLKSNIWLVEYLYQKYPIEYLIGHYEYTNFVNHPLWLEKDESYRTKKTDPGKYFMERVRKATKNLNFKPIPKNP